MSTKVQRYYAQWVEGTWRVFDRNSLDEQGGQGPALASCFLRSDAFMIRDALNEKEQNAA